MKWNCGGIRPKRQLAPIDMGELDQPDLAKFIARHATPNDPETDTGEPGVRV